MTKKDDPIKITRKQHKKMRRDAGYKYKFYVEKPKPYNPYKFLVYLSKQELGGDKRDVRKS